MCKKTGLQALVQTTNIKWGYTPKTPTEFNDLGIDIKKKTGYSISLSSLKRLWGYVDYKSFPSPNTLNILARYNDFEDWEDFLKNYDGAPTGETSEYLSNSVVDAESLNIGDVLRIEWEDEKSCELEYLSEHRFRVISSSNIKLQAEDTFIMHSVCVGLPFFAADIHRDNETIPGYVGAKNNGITKEEIAEILTHAIDQEVLRIPL